MRKNSEVHDHDSKERSQHHDLIESYKLKVLAASRQTENPDRLEPLFQNRIGLSIQEVAFYLGISSRTVERAIKNGDLERRRLGRRVIIPRQSIEAWLNRKD
jgi:excisionase family DNA binding protein